MLKFFPLLLLLTTPYQSIVNAGTSTLRFHGSDLFATWLPHWFEFRDAIAADLPSVEFRLNGSFSAISAMRLGHADACLILGYPPENLSDQLTAIPVGHHVLHLFAHSDFPVDAISQNQVRRIATSQLPDAIAIWSDFFESQGSAISTIPRIMIDTTTGSFALSLFQSIFTQGERLSDQLRYVSSREAAFLEIRKDPHFLFITEKSNLGFPNLKRLSLIADGDTVPFPPTAENVKFGDYPAHTPIVLITKTGQPWTQALINLFQSQAFAHQLEKENLYPEF